MRILIVGGLERNETQIEKLAALAGHEAVLHNGHTRGRGVASLEQLVAWAEVVVVITDVNSHGATQLSRKLAKRFGRPVHLWRRCGVARYREFLESLSTENEGLQA